MAGTTNLSIDIDNELKKNAERLYSELGMSMNTAIMIFLRQSVREQRIPFIPKVEMSNNEKAIRKAQAAFAGAYKDFGVENEDDVQRLIDEMRYGNENND